MYEGRLVRLRASEPEDAPILKGFMNDPDVTRFLHARYPFSLQDESDYVAGIGPLSFRNARHFAIEALADGRLIGGCGFHTTEIENRRAELGIAIGDKTLWSGGYGTDAMRVLCRVGFDVMNLHKIELFVFAPNTRARAIYERLGFRLEATFREGHHTRGEWVDEHLMGLLRDEFRREEES